MLTSPEIEDLNALARNLAHICFGGEGSVGRSGDGIVRLIIVKHAHGSGGLYRVREVVAPILEDARNQIALAIESATDPTGDRSALPHLKCY
jgi:hypothetical protein